MRFAGKPFCELFKAAVFRIDKGNVIFVIPVSCADCALPVIAVNIIDYFFTVCENIVFSLAVLEVHTADIIRKSRVYQPVAARTDALEHIECFIFAVFLLLNAHELCTFAGGFPFITGLHLTHCVTVALHTLAVNKVFLAVFDIIKLAFR